MSEEHVVGGELTQMFAELATPPEQKEEPEQDNGDPEQSQQDNAKQPEEQPEEDSGADDEVETDESEEGEEPEAEEADETEETVYEIDGEKFTPEQIKEFKQGYMRQDDYTRKTQELAEKGNAEIEQKKQQFDSQLQGLQSLIQHFNPLKAIEAQILEARELGDETQELKLLRHYDKTAEQVQNVFNAAQYEQQQKEFQNEEERKAYMAEQRDLLWSKLPELKDDKDRAGFQKGVYNTAKELGWTDEELAKLTKYDHRDALAYHYASKYLESMKAKPKAAEKLKGKAVSPKTTARKSNAKTGLDAAFDKFDKNPNAEGSTADIWKALG